MEPTPIPGRPQKRIKYFKIIFDTPFPGIWRANRAHRNTVGSAEPDIPLTAMLQKFPNRIVEIISFFIFMNQSFISTEP